MPKVLNLRLACLVSVGAILGTIGCVAPAAESNEPHTHEDHTHSSTSALEKQDRDLPVIDGVTQRYAMAVKGDKRCFQTNGIPDHETGDFPRRGNPNRIQKQDVNVCVPVNPQKLDSLTQVRGTWGIAVNGVQFRPNTAGYWDPNGRRGHSRNGDKNWSLDIHGAPGKLGLDFNNAHVGRGGLYHYHGIADHLTQTSGSSLIGYAGDGFEIHYVGGAVTSGWQLKSGTRPSGPGGKYDGTYNEDYEFKVGSDKLDECNGGIFEGTYTYFVTDSYPFVPRCVFGEMSDDFNRSRHR